jgi:sodium/pantothenate symporter
LASFYAMRKRSTGSFLNEYFLGSRSMGGFVLAMTLTATYISASSFIGGPGAAYKYGLGWVLLAMIQVPTIWLSLGILGKKFAILARRYNAITLNDMLFARYQSRAVVWLASVSLLVAFVGAMPCSLSAVRVCWKPPPVFPTKPGCSSSGSPSRCIPRLAVSAPAC